MISAGIMTQVEKPVASLPSIEKVKASIEPFNGLVLKMMVDKKNMVPNDPRLEGLNKRIEQTTRDIQTALTSLKKGGPSQLIPELEENLLILGLINNSKEPPELSAEQKELTENIINHHGAEKAMRALNKMDPKDIMVLIEHYTLETIANRDKDRPVDLTGFIGTINKYISANKPLKIELEALKLSSNIFQKHEIGNSLHKNSYEFQVQNVANAKLNVIQAREDMLKTVKTSFEAFDLSKDMTDTFRNFIDEKFKDIILESPNTKTREEMHDLVLSKQDQFNKLLVKYCEQIAVKLENASVEQKGEYETKMKAELPAFNKPQFNTNEVDHSIDLIAANLKSPAFLDTLFASLEVQINLEKKLSQVINP